LHEGPFILNAERRAATDRSERDFRIVVARLLAFAVVVGLLAWWLTPKPIDFWTASCAVQARRYQNREEAVDRALFETWHQSRRPSPARVELRPGLSVAITEIRSRPPCSFSPTVLPEGTVYVRLAFTNNTDDTIEYVPYATATDSGCGAWLESSGGRIHALQVAETGRVDPWAQAGWIPGRAHPGPSRVVTLAFATPPGGQPVKLHLRGNNTGSGDVTFEFLMGGWLDVDYASFRRVREDEQRTPSSLLRVLGAYTARPVGEP
jgi:hypothetical protein